MSDTVYTNVDDIKTNTDLIPAALAEIVEVDRHLHNQEKWFGLAAVPVAETHWADRMGGTTAPFQLLTGNSDFGNWVQVLGSGDTPVKAASNFYDLHRAEVISTNHTNTFTIQLVTGESAGIAAKLIAEDFTEFPHKAATNNNDSGISDVLDIRCPKGTKIWMRAACYLQNAKTIDLYLGLHEYPE